MSDDSMGGDPQVLQRNFAEALSAATPTAFVTPALIGINVLVYLAMVVSGVSAFSPTAREVVPWGADFGPLTTSGQWWRLLTACFVHFGIIHIAMNMFILFQVGIFTEKLLGNARFLLLYLLAGIGGNIAGLYFHPMTVAAGASGAVFGVYGGLLGFLLIERGVVPVQSAIGIAKSAAIFLVYNLIYGLARPETDLVAHIAGLLTGFVAGCFLARPLAVGREHLRPIRTLAVALGGIGLASAALAGLPKSDPVRQEWFRMLMLAPRVTVGTNYQVIYSGAATKSDAENLAHALVQTGFFRRPGAFVFLTRDTRGTSISLPLNGDESQRPSAADNITTKFVNGKTVIVPSDEKAAPMPWADPLVLTSMRVLGSQLESAIGDPPLTIRLFDSEGDLKNELAIDSQVVVGARDIIAYSGGATSADAQALGEALKTAGLLKDRGAWVHLSKDGGMPVVAFYVGSSTRSDSQGDLFLRNISHTIERSVGGPPIKVQLVGNAGEIKREVTTR